MKIKKGTEERSLLDSIKGVEKEGKKWLITLASSSGSVKVIGVPELQDAVDRLTKTGKTDPKKSPVWLSTYMQSLSRAKECDRVGMLATKIACTLTDTGDRIGGNTWYRDGFLLTMKMLREQSKLCVGEVALEIIGMFKQSLVSYDEAIEIASRQKRMEQADPELLMLKDKPRPCPKTKVGTWESANLRPGERLCSR